MAAGIIDSLLAFGREVLLPLGPAGLAALAFMEAVFFPVPPDVLLIPLVLVDPANGLLYGAIATFSSVVGGLAGYQVGLRGGRPLLIKLVGRDRVLVVEHYFQRYGALAVGIAALTPIPYKVFTIASGALKFRDIKMFILASTVGRGGRFMAEAALITFYGEAALNLIESNFELFLTIAALLGIAIFLAYHMKNRQTA